MINKNQNYKPELILHIGHEKTGTSSIQKTMSNNYFKLLKQGVLYPIRKCPRSNHSLILFWLSNSTFNDEIYLRNKKWLEKDASNFLNAINEDINKYNPHTVVLSAEHLFKDFSFSTKQNFSKFLNQYFSNVKIILYVRSPFSALISSVGQRIRTAKRNIFPKIYQSLKKIVCYYESQFPQNVYIRPFDTKQLVDGDIVNDFFKNYLPSITFEKIKKKRVNNSLSWLILIKLYQINKKFYKFNNLERSVLIRYYTKKLLLKATGKDMKKIPKFRTEFIEKYHQNIIENYLWLNDKYKIIFSDFDYKKNFSKENLKLFSSKVNLEDIFHNDKNLDIDIKNPNYLFLKFLYLSSLIKRYISHFRQLNWQLKKLNLFIKN